MLLERIRGYFAPEVEAVDEGRSSERRQAARRAVYLRATIYPIDVFSDARICDISATGARGEAEVELAIGQTLHITTDEKTYHTGKVKWTLDRQFGLDWSDAVAALSECSTEIDHGNAEGHYPRASRVKIDLSARLVGGRPPRPATVRNLSPCGMLLDTSPGLKPGQHIIVKIGNAPPVYGRTQWSEGSRIGFKAHTPICVGAVTEAVD